jgi:hypothetical protein
VNSVASRAATLPDATALAAFYNRYFETLDDGRLEEWPSFFTDDCRFEIIPRENYEAGYPLCTMQADSKGMLLDRVQGILKTQILAALLSALLLGPASDRARARRHQSSSSVCRRRLCLPARTFERELREVSSLLNHHLIVQTGTGCGAVGAFACSRKRRSSRAVETRRLAMR